MPRITVSASADLAAPPQAAYRVIADYRVGHPRILPAPWLSELVVEEGGVGAGTRIRFRIRMAGTDQTVHAVVTEPEPGKRLVETTVETGGTTAFIVDPAPTGGGCRVTFLTEWTTPGLRGWFERLVAPAMLRKVYAVELANLGRVAGEPGWSL